MLTMLVKASCPKNWAEKQTALSCQFFVTSVIDPSHMLCWP